MFGRFFRRQGEPPPTFGVRRASKPLPAVSIRQYDASDYEACMRLYAENEPGRFPPNTSSLYATHLNKSENLVLVLEEEGRVVGTGGVGLKSDPEGRLYGWLTFGLIALTHHRLGLGTASLLTRISLFPVDRLPIPIFLTAVWRSRSFYEQSGFRLFCRHEDEGPVAGFFITTLSPEAVGEARSYLQASKVRMPTEGMAIPVLPSVPAECLGQIAMEHAGVRWLRSPMREPYVRRLLPSPEIY